MDKSSKLLFLSAISIASIINNQALASDTTEIEQLKKEIKLMKTSYESRINDLESKLAKLSSKNELAKPAKPTAEISPRKSSLGNKFNPEISVVLNGKYASFSKKDAEISGHAIGEEGFRGSDGLAVDESELIFTSNIDDKFKGNVTAAIVREDGEDKIELEETYLNTLPGALPIDGLTVKAGRSFWDFGYLNANHKHTDNFADRPLPYRIFLNNGYNDDGIQFSYILPTDYYFELGSGLFRGADFPFNSDSNIGAYSLFARTGGDIGNYSSFRAGISALSGNSNKTRTSNEDTISFTGDTNLYAADFKYTFAPTKNAKEKEIILQGEYMLKDEKGYYSDSSSGISNILSNATTEGYYAEAIYKFHPEFRVGARYSAIKSFDIPNGLKDTSLDSNGHDPEQYSLMFDWTNSEFSRLRLQYNYSKPADSIVDNQFILQYVMSFGAHPAHNY